MVESHPAESAPIDESRLAICQRRIGYQFKNIAFLDAAFTHASGADHRLASNERLEFLGDAILGKIVCEELFHQFPEFLEGDLTKLKSIVVSRLTCAKISQALGLREFLVLGKGMTVHPAVPQSVLSDVLESLIAAIYLDGGSEPAKEFVLAYFGPEIESAASGDSGGNYKSLLQQFSQREHGVTPTYHLLDEKGPDHSKCFKMSAQIGRDPLPTCLGPQQEGIRTAGRPQRDLPLARRPARLPVGRRRRTVKAKAVFQAASDASGRNRPAACRAGRIASADCTYSRSSISLHFVHSSTSVRQALPSQGRFACPEVPFHRQVPERLICPKPVTAPTTTRSPSRGFRRPPSMKSWAACLTCCRFRRPRSTSTR